MKTGTEIASILRSFFARRQKRFTLTRGIGPQSVDTLKSALDDMEVTCSPRASDILLSKKFHLSDTVTSCELILVSAEEIGSQKGSMVTREEVYVRAERKGLRTCPSDVAPLMWLQYYDSIESVKRFAIGMDPLLDTHGEACIFCVQYERGERGLYGAHGDPHYLWHSDHKWLFCNRKKCN